jgi:hypothetical protein
MNFLHFLLIFFTFKYVEGTESFADLYTDVRYQQARYGVLSPPRRAPSWCMAICV